MQSRYSCVVPSGTVSASNGWLKMLRDQNPGLLLRFDPKFAVEFADFTDLELLTSAVGEGKVAMPRWVKLHAVKQLGQ